MELVSYKLASPMLQQVTSELGRIFKDKTLQVWKVDENLIELQGTYLQVGNMLGKLDTGQINPKVEHWLQDLVSYCYDTEDLVDDLILSQKDAKLLNYIFTSRRLTIPHQIGELQNKLRGRGSLIENLISPGTPNSAYPQISTAPCSRSLSSDKTPLTPGTSREQDKQKIIEKLTHRQSDSRGVSIIGMDGLGKTALARSILVDQAIKDHFPLVLSIFVSGHFQLEDIVKGLIDDHRRTTRLRNHNQTSESLDDDAMLQQLLGTHQSLIILDDLWSVTDDEWDSFVSNYLYSSPGWKILTTTRDPKVAEVTESASFYLNKMTKDDCTELIMHRAKLSGVECGLWSADIDIIASKCMGMPIIANKLGQKISKKQKGERKSIIVHFLITEVSKLQEFKEVIPSLNLNKPKLPPHIKRCIAYFSLFPPGHKFNRQDLIQLWEAEGFIQPQETRGSEECPNQCFDDLLARSILQPLKPTNNNQPIYGMHELNHEFAHHLASEAFCKVDEGTSNLHSSCENIRHLSITYGCDTDEPLLKKVKECKGLRTFLLLQHKKPKTRTISSNFFHELHSLRVLDLSHTNISKLPKPISPSKHLRYLDLSHTKVKEFPKSIRFLRALQILKLKGCMELLQLPKDLNQLISLTHLHVNMKTLRDKPSNIGMLAKLEVLDSFLVGRNKGYNVLELKNMDHLREIQICGLENIKDREEAREIRLTQKLWLRKLTLEWDSKLATKVINARDVLEGLQPHSHLEDLTVTNYGGQKFPTWLESSSCQLESIQLDNCQNCQVLPSLGQLPFLKILVVRFIGSVTSLDDQFHGKGQEFPSLELLEFHGMKALDRWTELKVGHMPCLCTLKIIDCPRLVILPSFEHLSCLIYLKISKCPKLESLPQLPSSLNGAFGELIIKNSDLISKRCYNGGAYWPEIKDIPYLEINVIRIPTKSSSQPLENDKDEVSMKGHQLPTDTKLVKESSVSQNGEQDPSTLQNHNESQIVQPPIDQDELSEKEHHSPMHLDPTAESCTSQNEDPRSKRPLPAPLGLVNGMITASSGA